MQRIVGAGLVGHQIRANAARDQFRDDIRRIAAQGNRHGFSLGRIFVDARQCVVQIVCLLIDIAGAQTEIDAALLAFNVQGTCARQRCGQRLCAAHAAQSCGQHPAAFQ
ncbi:hypothetical protein D3C80_1149090 [compost metagenome]